TAGAQQGRGGAAGNEGAIDVRRRESRPAEGAQQPAGNVSDTVESHGPKERAIGSHRLKRREGGTKLVAGPVKELIRNARGTTKAKQVVGSVKSEPREHRLVCGQDKFVAWESAALRNQPPVQVPNWRVGTA